MELERPIRFYVKSSEPDCYTNCDRYVLAYSEQYRIGLRSYHSIHNNCNR